MCLGFLLKFSYVLCITRFLLVSAFDQLIVMRFFIGFHLLVFFTECCSMSVFQCFEIACVLIFNTGMLDF